MEIENFDNRPKSKNGELIVNCRESSSGSVTHKPLDWPNCERETIFFIFRIRKQFFFGKDVLVLHIIGKLKYMAPS